MKNEFFSEAHPILGNFLRWCTVERPKMVQNSWKFIFPDFSDNSRWKKCEFLVIFGHPTVQNFHFRQTLIRKFQNFKFSYEGGIYFLQKCVQNDNFKQILIRKFRKLQFSYGGGTFFKKNVKNHHFWQILIRKFKKSSFLTGGSYFRQKNFKKIILAKICPEYCKITIFLRWILSKKCPKSVISAPIWSENAQKSALK